MQMFEYEVPQNISNKLVSAMLLKLLGPFFNMGF